MAYPYGCTNSSDQISSLPKTCNMKIMRRVVRAVYRGDSPGDLSALVNPEMVAELKGQLAG